MLGDVALIDWTLEKVFAELNDERKWRKDRQREFRDEVVKSLREYRTEVERFRVAANEILLRLARGERVDELVIQLTYDPSSQELEQLRENERKLDSLAVDAGQKPVIGEAALDKLSSALLSTGHDLRASPGLADAAATLDNAWPAVRALLDEAMEVDALLIFRRTRHELRAHVHAALEALERYESSGSAPNHRQVVTALTTVTDFADGWAGLILGVQRELD